MVHIPWLKELFINEAKPALARPCSCTGGDSGLVENVPINLLVNSNFANPVNQRGENLYKGKVYTIDRWNMSAATWMASIEDGCIKLSDNDANASNSTTMFRQYITVDPRLRGKTVTFVAKLKGNWMCRLNINNKAEYIGQYTAYKDADAATAYTDDEWHIRSWQGVIPEDANTIFVALQSKPWTDPNDNTNKITYPYYCEWVALYEGAYTDGNYYMYEDENKQKYFKYFGPNNLPEYQPNDYDAELAECKRYYQIVDSAYGTVSSSGSMVTAFLPVSVPMVSENISIAKMDITAIHSNGVVVNPTDCTASFSSIRPQAYDKKTSTVVLDVSGTFDLTPSHLAVVDGVFHLSADIV